MDSRKINMKKWLWSVIFFSCYMFVTDAICCLEKAWNRDYFDLGNVDNNGKPQNGHHFDLLIGDPFDKLHMDQQLNEKRKLESIFGPSASGRKRYHHNAACCTIVQKNQKFPKAVNGRCQPRK
jgi:hypothetical protein